MAALSSVLRSLEGGGLAFWCPGCEGMHQVKVGDGTGPRWGWNGDADRPSFTPSILVSVPWGDPPMERRCHLYVTDGELQYLVDSTHRLAGRTVPMEPFDGLTRSSCG